MRGKRNSSLMFRASSQLSIAMERKDDILRKRTPLKLFVWEEKIQTEQMKEIKKDEKTDHRPDQIKLVHKPSRMHMSPVKQL
jgi:hypothetical protein